MSITRAQIVRQMYEQGGTADTYGDWSSSPSPSPSYSSDGGSQMASPRALGAESIGINPMTGASTYSGGDNQSFIQTFKKAYDSPLGQLVRFGMFPRTFIANKLAPVIFNEEERQKFLAQKPNLNPPPVITGGDNQPIIPMQQMQVAQTPTDVEGTLSNFDLYMQGITSANPYRFTLDPRFAAAEGGVARQAYGLGSIVRKITKPIKKILKSDVGKAALLYGLGTYLGGTTAFGGSGKLKAWQRFKDPKLLKNLMSPQFLTSGETTSALSTVTPTTGADAVTAPFGRLNLEAATAAAEAAKPTPTLIDKAVTYAKDNPFPTVFGLSSLAGLSAAGEEDESLDGISDRTDNSGLKELIARYPELRFQVQPQYQLAANGGRMGYEEGGNIDPADLPMSREGFPTYEDTETGEEVEYPYGNEEMSSAPDINAELFQMYLDAIGSGQIPRATTFDQYKELMSDRIGAKEGGLMDLGGMEKDYRAEGGFVPIGKQEKADDVPARLSKNEFVFTADAVRNAGGGDIDKGAEVMYNVMKNLESGGKISDESQGLEGARDMFQTSQRLGEIL
jgi:hypothetical protein